MELPQQNPPVCRDLLMTQASLNQAGVEAAQTQCDSLQGMAQQICYSLEYGVST